MKFGLFGGAKSAGDGQAGDSLGYRTYIDYVLTAEALGFHSVFVVEHHFTGVGQVSSSLNFLTYLAGRTSRMRLGTAVVVIPWHNPALLAEQVATLDLLSNGRFDFGVGKGYRDYEFKGFCVPIEEAGERFEEAMAFLRTSWADHSATSGRFSFRSKNWRFENIVVEPRSPQQPHPPLWMAAGSFDSIRKAAREGYNLLLDQIATIDLILERVAVYKAERARVGRPYQPGQIAVARALQLVHSDEERHKALALRARVLSNIGDLARGPGAERYHAVTAKGGTAKGATTQADAGLASEESALLGTPGEIVQKLQKLRDGGVDYVILADPTGSQESLRLFAEQIMPAFADAPAVKAAE